MTNVSVPSILSLQALYSLRDEVIDADPSWEKQGSLKQRCRWCTRTPAEYYPKPLDAVVTMRQRASLSVAGPAMRILKRSLFDYLLPHMPGMIPGEVRYADGRVLRESVTVHFPPKSEILMRGGPGTRDRRAYSPCPICGGMRASRALFTKPWNVLKRDVPETGELFRTNEHVLLLTTSLAGRLDFSEFPDIELKPIPVLDTPLELVPELGDTD